MRYFGGKVGLLEALFDDAWAHLNARVDRAVKNADSSGECILDALQALVTALSRDPDLSTLFMFEGRRMRGDGPRVRLARGFIQFADTIRRLVREAQDAGDVDASLDPTAITSALLGATEAMIRDRLLAKRGSARGFAEREIRHTLHSMWRGMAPANSRHAAPRPRRR
jgi:AcrR family transcriptional regulator